MILILFSTSSERILTVKCVLWAGAVAISNANNYGQWRNQFQVLIAGSNGYIQTAYATSLANGYDPHNAPPTSQDFTSLSSYNVYSGYDQCRRL
jgi:hypothetical protein